MATKNTTSYTLKTNKSWSQTNREISVEFERWGVDNWETNYPKGAMREGSNQSEIDRTVTVTYQKNGKTIKLTMGKQDRAIDNLRVLFLAIQAMRMNEKRGIGEIIASAYLQLEAPVGKRDPYEVLGIRLDSPKEVAEAAYKALARTYHPDAGGTQEKMTELNEAINEIRRGK